MDSRATKQYWEGQYDALTYCARVLRHISDQNPTSEQLRRLARAIEIKAAQTGHNKLGHDNHGNHDSSAISRSGNVTP